MGDTDTVIPHAEYPSNRDMISFFISNVFGIVIVFVIVIFLFKKSIYYRFFIIIFF